jgi:ABC-2 type transport system permease protein
MRLFVELATRAFKRALRYRAAALAGLVTNFFFGLLNASILVALLGERSSVAGFNAQGVITYTAISQALIAYLSMFGSYELMTSVYTGEVASDLLKPMHLLRYYLAQDFGHACAQFLLRGVTIIAIYELMFDIVYPQGAFAWLALLVALLFAWGISFVWRFLVNLSSFWSPNAKGFGRLAFLGATFFSGMLMPLDFFPDWVQRLCYLTPFPSMLYTVSSIYLNRLTPEQMLQALALQVVWIFVLVGACQGVLTRGIRRLVIVGG